MSESTAITTPNHRQLGHRSDHVVYASAPFVIGKHEWQIIVIPADPVWKKVLPNRQHPDFNSDYYWRPIGQDYWHNLKQWPTYNLNDGVHGGCPRGLKKLFEQEKSSLAEFFPHIKESYEASDEGRQMSLI
tara:strand:+ start:5978 stop:6370 length:393 start_codon:yes stop_codon:yes gene_type:complete